MDNGIVIKKPILEHFTVVARIQIYVYTATKFTLILLTSHNQKDEFSSSKINLHTVVMG